MAIIGLCILLYLSVCQVNLFIREASTKNIGCFFAVKIEISRNITYTKILWNKLLTLVRPYASFITSAIFNLFLHFYYLLLQKILQINIVVEFSNLGHYVVYLTRIWIDQQSMFHRHKSHGLGNSAILYTIAKQLEVI